MQKNQIRQTIFKYLTEKTVKQSNSGQRNNQTLVNTVDIRIGKYIFQFLLDKR